MSNSFKLTGDNWKSIAKGALINIAGTFLLSVGMFLQAGEFTNNDFRILGFALLANLGAVIVNTVRKFISEE